MDYLKKLADQIGGKIEAQDVFSGNFQQKSFRALRINSYRTYRLRIDDFGSLFSIDIKVNADKAFSINKPDQVLFFNESIRVDVIPYPIFVSKIDGTLNSEPFIQSCKAMSSLLKKIALTADEGIFIARNVISFALRPDRDFVAVLDDILNVLDEHKQVFKRTVRVVINKEDIPKNLWELIPLLKKYSVSDDMDRVQLVEGMGKKKRKALIEAVDPHMHEINEYLSSFGERPMSEEAMLVGNLAELVSELKINQ